MTNLLRYVAGVVLGLGAVGLLLIFGTHLKTAPDNAHVITDKVRKTYASIPCVIRGHLDRELIKNRSDVSNPDAALVLMDYAEESTIAAARAIDYKPDEHCRNADGLMQEVTWVDRLVGYRSRWTPAGDWRW